MKLNSIFTVACESGWTSFGHTGHCYQYFSIRKTWNASRIFCQSAAPSGKLGDLASVADHFTNNFLSTLTSKYVWIGGYEDQESGWSWSDSTRRRYNSWASGQPSGGNQHHLAFNFQSSPGAWNDINLSAEMGFICKYTGLLLPDTFSL